VVLIAVLWAIAQQLKWPVLVQAVLAGLAAAAALIIPALRARFGQDDKRIQLVGHGVTIPAGSGRLPRVRDVKLKDLRVHAARVEVSYIERDQQDKLAEAVGRGQAALNASRQDLRGNDTMGKSVWKIEEKEGTYDSPNHLTPIRYSNPSRVASPL
jgi:hypothetical protein